MRTGRLSGCDEMEIETFSYGFQGHFEVTMVEKAFRISE